MNAGSRSHGAVTTPSPICSGSGTAASHTHLVAGDIVGDRSGRGKVSEQPRILQDPAPTGNRFKPLGYMAQGHRSPPPSGLSCRELEVVGIDG